MTPPPWRRVVLALKVPAAGDAASDAPPGSGGTQPAAGSGEVAVLRESMQGMRDHLSKFGGAIGALATAILAGIGWVTIQKLVPLPPGRLGVGLAIAAAAFAAVGIGCAVWLTRTFFIAGRRIVIHTEDIPPSGKDSVNQLTADEVGAAQLIFGPLAAEMSASGVKAIELRARRLGRMAQAEQARPGGDKDRAKRLQDESDRLIGRLDVAGVWACLKILEVRVNGAFKGRGTLALVLAVGASIVGMLVVSSWSQHDALVADRYVACVKSLAAGELPGGYSCRSDGVLVPPASPAGPATADTAVVDRLATCRQQATAAPDDAVTQLALAQCAGLPAPTSS